LAPETIAPAADYVRLVPAWRVYQGRADDVNAPIVNVNDGKANRNRNNRDNDNDNLRFRPAVALEFVRAHVDINCIDMIHFMYGYP
jgi:hypothetical protein